MQEKGYAVTCVACPFEYLVAICPHLALEAAALHDLLSSLLSFLCSS